MVEMARCMLKGKGLPDSFWAKAVHTAVYILNRSYTKAVQGKTPLEAYSDKKPFVSHYWIFGSECYAHVPDKLRTKLEDKSRKCIFLGYIKETKGYRLYDVEAKKIIVSRDVVFAERPHAMKEDEDPFILSPIEKVTHPVSTPIAISIN